jgi:hypothetical protein
MLPLLLLLLLVPSGLLLPWIVVWALSVVGGGVADTIAMLEAEVMSSPLLALALALLRLT